MGKQSIPWAVGLTGLLYFGMLGYWQSEAFETALGLGGNVSQNSIDGAIFGFVFGILYVAYMMACFLQEMPEGLKEVPIVGRYGKMLGWLAFLGVAVWYCTAAVLEVRYLNSVTCLNQRARCSRR